MENRIMVVFAEISGWIAISLMVLAMALRDDRHLVATTIFCNLAWLIYNVTLGFHSAAATVAIAAIVMVCRLVIGEDGNPQTFWEKGASAIRIILVTLTAVLCLWAVIWVAIGRMDLSSGLPLVAGAVFLFGTGYTRGAILTSLLFVNCGLWLMFGLSIGSNQIIAANIMASGALLVRSLPASLQSTRNIRPAA